MGGGGKNAASREASRARKEEEARQARIRQGTSAINRTFDGGTVGTGAVAAGTAYDPTKKYYLADGTEWSPSSGGGSGLDLGGGLGTGLGGLLNPGEAGGRSNKSWEDALKNGLFSGVEQRTGFNDKFYGDLRDSFVNFARPQVDDQYRKASEQSTFGLARSGLMDSSVRGEQGAELRKQYDINLQDIMDKARGYETEARNNVERSRGDLISMLQATGDATGAANSALTRASTLAAPPAYSPLGQLFQDSTAMLSQQMAAERAFALGLAPKPRGSAGLYAPSGSSTKVT